MGKKRFSKDQVRAWLATVIVPIVEAVEIEVEYARQENWTFRCYNQDFELLLPIRKAVSPLKRVINPRYQANLDQFLDLNEDTCRVTEFHDEALDRLRKACSAAFDALMESTLFETMIENCIPEVEQKNRKCLAEYVINGHRDLTPDYTYFDYWKENGENFLLLRENPELQQPFNNLREEGKIFTRSAVQLLQNIEIHQKNLADQYKLPRVVVVPYDDDPYDWV
jgi:hypothetical protein